MKRLVSTALAVALLLGLGALAVLARGGGDILSPVKAAPVALAASQPQTAAAPEAPQATEKWNNIAMPLGVSGVATADDVAAYINSNTNPPSAANSITSVARWDASGQGLVIRDVGSSFGEPNFPVQTGDWLLVSANANSATDFTFAWVGNVPAAGYRTYSIVADGWSAIMLPLNVDTTTIQTADDLAVAIGGVASVAKWDASGQGLIVRDVGSSFGEPDFAVRIGYPYLVYSTEAKNWP